MFCLDRCTVPFPNVSPRDLTGKNPWRKLDARAESPERMATLARSCLSGGHLYATAAASPRFAARTNERRTNSQSVKSPSDFGLSLRADFPLEPCIPASVRPSVRPPSRSPYYFYHISRLQKFSLLYLSGEASSLSCTWCGDRNREAVREGNVASPHSVPPPDFPHH